MNDATSNRWALTMDTSLRHLKHLIAAVQYGSFRRAAQALNMRQSTLSRTIKQLEDGLGVTLLVRSAGGVRLTPAGHQFLETARRVLGDFERLVATAKALGRGSAGRLVLGLPPPFVSSVLRGVLMDYANEFPDVAIQLVVNSKFALLSDLDVGTLDLAIVRGGVPRQGCETLSLWPERIVVAVPKQHSLARKPFVVWADLVDEVLLTSFRGFGPELKEILAANTAENGTFFRMEEHAADDEALLSLVAAGRGLMLQTSGAVRDGSPDVAYLEVRDTTGTSWVTFYACWKKDCRNPTLASFLPLLRAHCSLLSSVEVSHK
jgi:DNA-binding transcriptional LysR family regulator